MHSQLQLQDESKKFQNVKMSWSRRKTLQESLCFNFNSAANQAYSFQLPDVFTSSRIYQNKSTSPRKRQNLRNRLNESCFGKLAESQIPRGQRESEVRQMETQYFLYKNQMAKKPHPSPGKKQRTSQEAQHKFGLIDGVRFPYSLYMMHRNRKRALDSLMHTKESRNSCSQLLK